MRSISLALLLAFILIGLLILAPIVPHFGDALIYPVRFQFTDLTITHWPAFAYLRDQLTATGQLPLWRTSILSGTPFASDPLSGWFYAPHWITCFPPVPLPLAFNLLMLAHLALAALAMYVMLRSWHAGRIASFAAAVAYAASPKIIAHMSAGHVTLVEAWAWLPLIIAALSRDKIVLAGIALALCLLADSRMALYAAILAVTYLVVRGAWLKLIGRSVIVIIVAIALSAVAWLPTLSFANSTSRSALVADDAGVFSLDPIYLLGLLVADRTGAAERTTYVGLIVLALALFSLARVRKLQHGVWLIGVVILGTILALGTYTPLYNVLYQIPGLALLRVPARAWFMVSFALPALAGLGLHQLIESIKQRTHSHRIPLVFALFVIGLSSVDLLTFAWAVYRPVSIDDAFGDGRAVAQWLAQQPRPFRVYSPSYSIPQHVAQQYHLQLADGIDPLQLARYVTYMQRATGIGPWRYSVTLPPFLNAKTDADIRTANANIKPDAALLGLMNVKYIVAAFPIDSSDLIERARFGSTIVYENERVLPRALITNRIAVAADPAAAAQALTTVSLKDTAIVEGLPFPFELPIQAQQTQIVEWQADRIKVQVTGPGLLVLSEVDAPDWIAAIDNVPTAIYPTDVTLRGVFVPWGDHTIELRYEPRRVYAGLIISALSGVACAAALIIRHRIQR